MYINFHKYNYDIVPKGEREQYEDRDKSAYKEVLKNWFDSHINEFVSRKWEVEEIHYLKQISDFIKPIQEAESLYELGFFTSCIALVGISAEDYTKYISLTHKRTPHINKSQFDRLNLQLSEGIINKNTHDLLDRIRIIRNNCLHYNNNFKQKSDEDLKRDAIEALNNLKTVLKNNIGTSIDPNDAIDLLHEIYQQENHRGFEEIIWKQRNMMSHVFNIPQAFSPGIQKVERIAIFKVEDIDEDEITLKQIMPPSPVDVVWVDIDEKGSDLISDKQIRTGNYVMANIYSNVAKDGTTQFWFIENITTVH